MKKTAPTAKKKTSRTALRIEKHLASQNADLTAEEEQAIERAWQNFVNQGSKTGAIKPLRPDEYTELSSKMDDASSLCSEIVDSSQIVQELREQLVAEETNLRGLRSKQQTLLRELAPLLHRLPTV